MGEQSDKFDEMAHAAFDEWYFAIDDKRSVLQEYDRHTLTTAIAALLRREVEGAEKRADLFWGYVMVNAGLRLELWDEGERVLIAPNGGPIGGTFTRYDSKRIDGAMSAAIRARGAC